MFLNKHIEAIGMGVEIWEDFPCVVCLRKISFRWRGTFAIEQAGRSFLLFTGVPLCYLQDASRIVDTKKRRTL